MNLLKKTSVGFAGATVIAFNPAMRVNMDLQILNTYVYFSACHLSCQYRFLWRIAIYHADADADNAIRHREPVH